MSFLRRISMLSYLGLALLLGCCFYIQSQYPQLPDTIPTHFGAGGKADGFGDKAWIWMDPAVGFALWLLLVTVSFFPMRFNYPVTVTEANRPALEKLGRQLVQTLSLSVAILFAFITYSSIVAAQSAQPQLDTRFFLGILALVLGPVFVFLIKMSKLG